MGVVGWLRAKRRRWVTAAALLAVLLVSQKLRDKLPEVAVAEAARGPLDLTIAASGEVEGVASELSFPAGGRITELYVREGEAIRPEQTLARVEPLGLPATGGPVDVIRAPYAGHVVDIYQREGAVVQAGQPVLRCVRAGPVWVTAFIDSEDAAWVSVGDSFTGRSGGYLARPWRLTVESIGREAVQRKDVPGSGKQIRVRLRPAESGFPLPVGTPVDVDGEVRLAADALLIPAAAVVRENGRTLVWRLTGETVARIEVGLGANNFRQIIVEQGLAAGDRVVVEGKTDLTDGQRVRAKPWDAGQP